jgi:hypothetical protein
MQKIPPPAKAFFARIDPVYVNRVLSHGGFRSYGFERGELEWIHAIEIMTTLFAHMGRI